MNPIDRVNRLAEDARVLAAGFCPHGRRWLFLRVPSGACEQCLLDVMIRCYVLGGNDVKESLLQEANRS